MKIAIIGYSGSGKSSPSMTRGCDEKMDLEFIFWILHSGRTCEHTKRYKDTLADYPDKCTVIRNQRQLTQFINRNIF
ncbi:MAG: hypothetical protein IKY33_03740 [Clostridia bacterium]|nr:hypothetical protein [Clostridia bacterium]